jgi:hypothetical protein
MLQFETDEVITGIEIVGVDGRVYQKTPVSNNERQIAVSQLNKGTYFAVFYTKGQRIVRKIVIEK